MNSGSWKWRRSEAALHREALDDVVILPNRESEPFAVTGGAALWRLLKHPHTTEELLTALSEGMMSAPHAKSELDSLLTLMADSGAVDRMST